jgi:toxin FitB
MTRYLLDTNVVSETRKRKPHGAASAWMAALHVDQIHISAVSIGELQRGIEKTRRQDAGKAQELELWLDQLQATSSVLPMDASCFREWARLMEGKTEDLLEDAMIAATARVHRLTVATRNTTDFALLDVAVFDPFRSEF